jgi:hypothetical protein
VHGVWSPGDVGFSPLKLARAQRLDTLKTHPILKKTCDAGGSSWSSSNPT